MPGRVATAGWAFVPSTISTLSMEAGRLLDGSDPPGVLEARPLLTPFATFTWLPAWDSFRAMFFIGVPALVLFATRPMRSGSRINPPMADDSHWLTRVAGRPPFAPC
jgi:hypothetical protein